MDMDYKQHYQRDAREFDYWGANQFSPAETRRLQTIFELCPLQAGQRVLDIGSGRGWFARYAAESGAQVTAVDLSEDNLQKIKALDSRIETIVGDACDLPITDKLYDWIVAIEVLEHLTDPKTALQNWLKLLKPEGRLLLVVPDKEVLAYTLCIHCHQKTPVNAHLHSFDQDSLIKLLNKTGYWVKDTRLFLHKLLTHLRLVNVLSWLPYRMWRRLDRLCAIAGKRYHYLAVVACQARH